MTERRIEITPDIKILRVIAGAGLMLGLGGGAVTLVKGMEVLPVWHEAWKANKTYMDVYERVMADDLISVEEERRLDVVGEKADETYDRAREVMDTDGRAGIASAGGAALSSIVGFLAAIDARRRIEKLVSEGE